MFGDDDFIGDKPSNNSKQQYGRNQQYGRTNVPSTSNNQQLNNQKQTGGVLKFNDDSDSDDDLVIGNNNNNNKSNNINSNLGGGFSQQKNTFNNQSQMNNNSSTFEDRPSTSSKQNVMDRQRDNFLNKQKIGFGGNQSMTFNNKPGSGYTYGQNTDGIDFDKLQTIVNNNNSSQYVPGELGQKGSGLAPVSKMNNMLKFSETNEIKNNNNIINLEDSDDEDEGINILNKGNTKSETSNLKSNTNNQSETQTKTTEQQPEQNINQARAQADQLLKNLYGDSSEDSENENEEAAHKKKLEEKKTEGGIIGDEDDDPQEAEQAPVGILANQPATEQNTQQMQQQIANQQAPQQYYVAENIEIFDMKQFLTKPIPKGMIIQTQIRRDKSGFARFYPKYHVHLSSGQRYLLTGKKRSNNKTSNYLMSMSKTELSKKSPHFLGKVRSNFLGTEFHVYNTGENPKKCKNIENVRKELAGVIYESNLLGARGPRKMKVLIPDIQPNGEPISIRPTNNKEGIFPMFKSGRRDGLLYFSNKPPKWNESVQAFVLNFNGRVDRPSVKNFQLVDESNDELILLQFGRVGDDAFNMDIMYPFSITQAFGICLSSFDYKIACE